MTNVSIRTGEGTQKHTEERIACQMGAGAPRMAGSHQELGQGWEAEYP